MSIVLALGAAAFYGSADFVGALASRRTAALAVALGAQAAGLAALLVVMPFLGPSTVSAADLAFGGAAGIFGGVGLVVVYRSLAIGPMSVVAPTTALSASAVPVVVGIALGDRPGPAALGGIAVALVAVALITRESGDANAPADRRAALRALAPALAGGAIFGLFFVMLHQTGDHAGLWPLLAARLTSVVLLAALVVARRVPFGGRRFAGAVLVSGVLDMTANVLYLLAVRHGMLAVVAALTGLYPASTVVLAQTRLDERLRPVQMAGLAVAVVAALLVAS